MSAKKATLSVGNYLQSSDVVEHMVRKFGSQGYSEGTLRNDIGGKKIKADKKEKLGKTTKLLFSQKTLDQYVRDRAELYAKKAKTGKAPIKVIKSPDLTEFPLSVYKNKLDALRLFISDEEIKTRLNNYLDSMASKAMTKINELKQSIDI